MRVVYRVHKRGDINTGLYRSNTAQDSMQPSNSAGYRHPLPYDDAALSEWYQNIFEEGRHRFGFASIKQLKMWIYSNEHRAGLDEEDYIVTLLSSDDTSHDTYCEGDTQAIYDPGVFEEGETYRLVDI